jgi:hypothetical protein
MNTKGLNDHQVIQRLSGLKGEENFKGLDSKKIKITKNIRSMQACAQK